MSRWSIEEVLLPDHVKSHDRCLEWTPIATLAHTVDSRLRLLQGEQKPGGRRRDHPTLAPSSVFALAISRSVG